MSTPYSDIALREDTGEHIDIDRYPRDLAELKQYTFICHKCEKRVDFHLGKAQNVDGSIRRSYFHHRNESCQPLYRDPDTSPESNEHLLGKRFLQAHLAEKFPEYVRASSIAIEYRLPEAKRIADVLVVFPDGRKIAHELQITDVSIESMKKRTESYNHAGIEVIWWFVDKSALWRNSSSWCWETFGLSYSVVYVQKKPRELKILSKPSVKEEPVAPPPLLGKKPVELKRREEVPSGRAGVFPVLSGSQQGSIVDVDTDPFGAKIYTYRTVEGKEASFLGPILVDSRLDIPGGFVFTRFGKKGDQRRFTVFMETKYPGEVRHMRETIEAKTGEEALELLMRKHGIIAATYAEVDSSQGLYDILLLRGGLFLRKGN